MDSRGSAPAHGFICDLMLKRLTRWMRIAGLDVLQPSRLDDDDLASLSMASGRVLLTRDKNLSGRKEVHSYRILSTDLKGQLEEVTKAFPGIFFKRGTTRCPLCNTPLTDVDLTSLTIMGLSEQVPPKVAARTTMFYPCPGCKKIYWKGGHWEGIERTLQDFGLAPLLPNEVQTEK